MSAIHCTNTKGRKRQYHNNHLLATCCALLAMWRSSYLYRCRRYLGLWIGMSISLLLLSGCTSWFWNTSDPFLAEIVDARMNSTKADIDIADIVEKYIPIGTPRAEAETFLKRRGFKTYFYENQYTLVESGKAVLGVKAGPKSFFPCETETKVILYLSEDLVVLRLEGHIFTSCL